MRVKARLLTIYVSLFFMSIGVIAHMTARGFPVADGTLGAGLVPLLLSALLFLTAGISFFTALFDKKDKETVKCSYILYFALFFGATIMVPILMFKLNFYFLMFLFFVFNFFILNKNENKKRLFIKSFLLSIALTGIFYLGFSVILKLF